MKKDRFGARDYYVLPPADKRPGIIQSAEKFVKAHPKLFPGLAQDQAISRALYLHGIGQVQFEDERHRKF
jgi:hypothetical protein